MSRPCADARFDDVMLREGISVYFFFQAEDGIRDIGVTGVQTCALPICKELIGARAAALRAVRGNDVGLIFQEPMTALNPVLTVGFQVTEVLLSHQNIAPEQARERAVELFRLVDLPNPEGRYDAYPHQLSGGQRQRVMIAMAIACDPVLLIADEPTTALDVTVQAEILDLLRDLHQRLDSAILLITHEIGVVADLADKVVVMRDGGIVEAGPIRQVFSHPEQAYTRDLLSSVPHLGAEIASAQSAVEARERGGARSEEHTSELQSRQYAACR